MSGPPNPDPPDGPGGLVVMLRDDPHTAARALASDLGAELVVGGDATEALVERLATAGGQLEHRDLDALDDAVRRAEATRDRTRAAVAQQLSQKLHTALAIHPDTLRRAAAEVLPTPARAGARPSTSAPLPPSRRRGSAPRRAACWPSSGVAVAGLGSLVGGIVVVAVGLLPRRRQLAARAPAPSGRSLRTSTPRWPSPAQSVAGSSWWVPASTPTRWRWWWPATTPSTTSWPTSSVTTRPCGRPTGSPRCATRRSVPATQTLIHRDAGRAGGPTRPPRWWPRPYDGLTEERCPRPAPTPAGAAPYAAGDRGAGARSEHRRRPGARPHRPG